MLETVARLSSRVFLGKPLCRNREWLEITKNYTVDAFTGAFMLRTCPGPIRPLIHWFIPQCKRLRAHVRGARRLIMDEVTQRRIRAEKTLEAGERHVPTAKCDYSSRLSNWYAWWRATTGHASNQFSLPETTSP